ncbi:MAG TPA: hypothetical protein VKV04_05285 [Verrucomicrobiae bacterium]|nr:hypothetical protein [Verrucomicrobiae bacterium]
MKSCLRLFLLAYALIAAALLSSCSTESRIHHYQGDGEITANPDYGLTQGGGGYTLKFKPSKLDRSAHYTYHFKGLPRSRAEVLFAVEDSRTWEDKRFYRWYQQTATADEKQKNNYACYSDLTGKFSILLKDADGKEVLRFNKKISELTWSRGNGPWELYDERAVNFTPDGREYTLEVTIDPDPTLKGNNGYVLIRGLGREALSIGF